MNGITNYPGIMEQITDNRAAVVEALRASLIVLHTDGWCQNVSQNPAGQRCINGAIFAVEDQPMLILEIARRAASLHLRAKHPGGEYYVSTWNDNPGRTFEEVEELLNSTIAWVETVQP